MVQEEERAGGEMDQEYANDPEMFIEKWKEKSILLKGARKGVFFELNLT